MRHTAKTWRTTSVMVSAVLAIVGTMAFAAAGAYAASTDHTACQFTGLAGSITPSASEETWPAPTGLESVANDNTEPQPSTDTGTYTFNSDPGSTTNCVLTDANNSGDTTTWSPAINSKGSYVNQKCGTGTATGDTGVTDVTGPGTTADPGTSSGGVGAIHDTGTAASPTYDIPFTAGAGTLTINQLTWSGHTFSSGGSANGGVSISPTGNAADGNCVTTNVNKFKVAGSFTVDFTE
jgi:hypothetical protein